MTDFKHSTIYQVYPKSFYDSNGDGTGDIRGIIEKLDYIKSLGADLIWSTPFFVSPQNDNGYDVADYYAINPDFGTMSDVEELILEADKRGMGLMLDMVFNHTSTEHEWFKKALSGDEKYMNYYIFRDGAPDVPPTNWQSKFGGPAWEYVPNLKKWYLHLFDVTQADLNWENPEVREELKNVIRFWKDKGVKGFRFDVINLISKPDEFTDDDRGDGRRFYTDGPRIHEYLKELSNDTELGSVVSVGEMSSTTLENCIRYSNPDEKELSMCFNFHHLKVDYRDGKKWELMPPDYRRLKALFEEWQLGMQAGNGWNALFWCNHDQPRIVSRFGDTGRYWKESAKMLAVCIHMMRGTPYIYQGEELGMTNPGYETIDDYEDVESINYHRIMLAEGKTEKEAMEILANRSRDNGRTPMQWNDEKNAGFTEGTPWLKVAKNYEYINVEAEEADSDSILNFYRRLVKLRKDHRIIQDGSIDFILSGQDEVFAYERESEGEKLMVLNNLTGESVMLDEEIDCEGYEYLIGNYDDAAGGGKTSSAAGVRNIKTLRPYESVVLIKK